MAAAFITGHKDSADTAGVGGTTIAVTISGYNWTAGNHVCVQTGSDSVPTISTLADTLGNTYVKNQVSAVQSGSDQRIDGHFANNLASGGGNTITGTYNTSAVWRHIHVSEYSGVATQATPHKSSGNIGTGTTYDSGSQTTTVDGCLIYGGEGNGSGTVNAGSGFTKLLQGTSYANVSEFQIQSAAGSISASFTGSSANFATIMMAFTPAGVAASGSRLTLTGVGA